MCIKHVCISLCFNMSWTFYRYLALVAALACEADFVFIPESPHLEGWEDKLCKKLRSVSLRATFINMSM